MLDGEQKGWDAAGKRVWQQRWWGEPIPRNVLAGGAGGDSSFPGFCDGARHPLDPSLPSPPHKGLTPAWAPQSPALFQHPAQVSARELAATWEQE